VKAAAWGYRIQRLCYRLEPVSNSRYKAKLMKKVKILFAPAAGANECEQAGE
jgi:hypothetical protein